RIGFFSSRERVAASSQSFAQRIASGASCSASAQTVASRIIERRAPEGRNRHVGASRLPSREFVRSSPPPPTRATDMAAATRSRLLLIPAALALPTSAGAPADDLPVDPASLLLWNEAVGLVRSHEAEIWPGYRLAEIPALVTHPKVGEILLRHPQ